MVEASLALAEACDPGAPGAAVTTELCGHWEHEGPCRWPHNSAIDAGRDPAGFRTIFVAEPAEAPAVADRIERALRARGDWRVEHVAERAVEDDERALATRLLTGPRRSA